MGKQPIEMLSDQERLKRIQAGRLRWFHWLIVSLSLVLTLGAWYISKTQVDANRAYQFQREAERVAELITERMQKYEDALWGGVGTLQAHGGQLDVNSWKIFADTLHINTKYPGINGIGVIYHVLPDQLNSFITDQRRLRPQFKIHPPHRQQEYLPITFIEPIEENRKAEGLDMAHETNRYTAAKKARDSGQARMTGPIVLVQDAEKTPGFLLYAPFYRGAHHATIEERRANFGGMVYAPFVMKKLLAGTLDKEKRHVDIRVSDGTDVLYNELNRNEPGYDPSPLFKHDSELDLYGRSWHLTVWSNKAFRTSTASNQPFTILIGGIVIDTMLLLLFVSLARANRGAIDYADHVTETLRLKTVSLQRSNADLEQFAYVASHDLQEPLRMVGNFTQLLQSQYQGNIDAKADQYIAYTVDGVKRMQQLLNELLEYSRLGRGDVEMGTVSSWRACETAISHLSETIAETGAIIDLGNLPDVHGDETQLIRIFQNLISNGIKFRTEGQQPHITINAADHNEQWLFSIKDNGIGIEPQYLEKIFVMFQRLHNHSEYPGTGVGLAVCKKCVIQHGGDLWVESTRGEGTTFFFTLPKPMDNHDA